MAFPRLVLEGDASKGVITDIRLKGNYDADYDGALKKMKHTIRRQATNLNVSNTTPARHPSVPYDQVRMIHTWVGYVDVMSDSLVYESGFGEQATTWDLLTQAWLYKTNVTYEVITQASEGLGDPSNDGLKAFAVEPPPFWITVNIDGVGGGQPGDLEDVPAWFVKNIDVTDNGNSTSKVVFTFEASTIWKPIYNAIV